MNIDRMKPTDEILASMFNVTCVYFNHLKELPGYRKKSDIQNLKIAFKRTDKLNKMNQLRNSYRINLPQYKKSKWQIFKTTNEVPASSIMYAKRYIEAYEKMRKLLMELSYEEVKMYFNRYNLHMNHWFNLLK